MVVFAAVALPAQALEVTIINQYHIPDASFRLVSSEPYEGETLDAPPAAITLNLTYGARGDKSYIKVTDMYGSPITDGSVQIKDTTMSAPLPALAPGTYRVRWKAHCQCEGQDELSDSFKFTVR